MTEVGAQSLADERPGYLSEDESARRAELVNLYYQVPIAVVVNILLASLVVLAFWKHVPLPLLLGWWGLIAGINVARWWTGRLYRNSEDGAGYRPGLKTFTVLALASGATWGVSAPLFVPLTGSFDQQFVLLIVMAGLAAGAIPLLAVVLRVYLAYLLVLLAPACAWLLLSGEGQFTTVGMMALVFAAAMASAGRHYATNFRRSQMLATALALAKSRAEEANTELRQTITETREMQDALRASERRFQTAFEQAPIGIALLDAEGQLMQANPTLADLFGYSVNELQQKRITALVLDEDLCDFERTLEILLAGDESRTQTDVRFVRADGDTFWAAVAMASVYQEHSQKTSIIVQFHDITESVKLSTRLQYEAAHDELTGFVNRREFERRLQGLLATRHGTGAAHTLCYLDLDRFKVINDREGHIAGDEVLRQVAALLHEQIRGGDTIARVGGDEFAILLEHCDVEAATRIADTLVSAVSDFRFCWGGKVFRIDLSIGVAPIGPEHHHTNDILRVADTACAAAKDAGGAQVHVYRPEDHEVRLRKGEIEWLEALTDALDRDAFELYGQQIVPIAGPSARDRLHVEILARMHGPGADTLMPSSFLPAAERYGLAVRLDQWIVDAVISWLEANPGYAQQTETCAINLSGASLGDTEFKSHLLNRLQKASLDTSMLRFEITETAAIGHLAQARSFMRSLESVGCHFSLDDFGSGLSSFAYLRSLPVDTLKIDGQFIRDMAHDQVDHALVKSIKEIGRVLGLITVAECVEDDATLELLRDIGVDFVQGYHLGYPRPLAEIYEGYRRAIGNAVG